MPRRDTFSICINLYGAEPEIFQEKLVTTMAVDDLAPSITWSSAAIVLNLYDNQLRAFHEEKFQLNVPNKCFEIIENTSVFLYNHKRIRHTEG